MVSFPLTSLNWPHWIPKSTNLWADLLVHRQHAQRRTEWNVMRPLISCWLHSICQQVWKTQQWPQDWKRSIFIPIPKKGNAKECSNYHTIALISHASKVMLKILQARLQNMWTINFLMFKLVLEKAEDPEIKFPTSVRSSKRPESSRKTSISALLTMPKPLTVWITINCGKFFKRWEYQTT